MQEKGFWDDTKRAEEVTKKSKFIKDKMENFDTLQSKFEDIEVLKDMMEEDDEESSDEIIINNWLL